MAFEGLHNHKNCAGEYQPQQTFAKNRKNRRNSCNRIRRLRRTDHRSSLECNVWNEVKDLVILIVVFSILVE